MAKRKIPQQLLAYVGLVKGLGTMLGRDCEVLLHDVSHPESSIIACENGHVSGRGVGSPMTDFGLLMQKDPKYRNMDGVYNYLAKTEEGKVLKCGVFFIKNEAGKIIGYLCINMDITKVRAAQELLGEFFKVDGNINSQDNVYRERFSREPDDVTSSSIASVKERWGNDLSLLPRADKTEVIRELEEGGFFLIKGAMERLAAEMKRSKFTLYAYIREVRESTDEEFAERRRPI